MFILSIAASVFFSANVYALQFFLPGKFLASITRDDKEEILNRLSAARENLLFVCSLFRLLCNMLAILFMLISFRSIKGSHLDAADYIILVAGAFLIFMVFSSALPYSWAKYAGQIILSRTCSFLFAMLFISRPLLWIYKVIDILIRRLAAVPEITEEQRQEQFLDGVEQRKIEGIVDEQEQEMIENVFEMSRKTAEEIMTPRTEIIAIDAASDRLAVLNIVTSAGHSRFPVYEQNLDNKQIRKIILARPAVEAGEKLGFLPGDIQAKVNPYLSPLFDALGDTMDYVQMKNFMEMDVIEIIPLAFMRGRTLNEAVIICDEAQNTSPMQMLMVLTRLGRGSKMIVTGDITQIDLDKNQKSGMVEAIEKLRGIKGIGYIELARLDIVRHKLVQLIVHAYERDHKKKDSLP